MTKPLRDHLDLLALSEKVRRVWRRSCVPDRRNRILAENPGAPRHCLCEQSWGKDVTGHGRPGDHERVPRGPTRRLHQFLDQAPGADPRRLVTMLGLPAVAGRLPAAFTLEELLDQAAHEAALLRHPYIGPEHVRLAAAARVPDHAVYRRLREELLDRAASGPGGVYGPGWFGTHWRPRGPRSAARRRGQHELEAEQRRAQQARDRQAAPGETR